MFISLFHKQIFLKKGKSVCFSLICVAFFILSSFAAIPANAMGNMSAMGDSTQAVDTSHMSPLMRFIEVDNDTLYTPIDVSLDIVGIIIMLIAAIVVIKSIREYGRSTIGIALIYFFNATIVLGAIRLIFILDDDSISAYANVKDVTEMTAWHILFYFAIVLFYLAGKTLTRLVSSNKGKSSFSNALYLMIFSVLLATTLITLMPMAPIQNFLSSTLENTWFETFGWFHIIALVMASGIAIYLYTVKSKFKGFAGVIGNLYISLGLLASIHLWELLNESWRVIIVSDDFGEFIERCLWVPVFLFILYSFMKLRRMAVTETAATAASPQPMIPNPNPTAINQQQNAEQTVSSAAPVIPQPQADSASQQPQVTHSTPSESSQVVSSPTQTPAVTQTPAGNPDTNETKTGA